MDTNLLARISMSISRRSFVATLGATGAGVLGLPLISSRGNESLYAFQGVADRRADRMLAERPGMIRLDSNENPNGPGERVFETIRRSLTKSNRYPVKAEDDLIAAIAQVNGVKPENIILGCGSGELLRAAVYAFTTTEHGLVSPEPTFEAPGNFAKFLGRPVMSPKVDSELKLDLNAMTDAAKGAGLVFFCNPNNPTATVHGKAAVQQYIDAVNKISPQTIILVDEAYHEYVDDPGYATAIPLALANPRVVVTRTFSKVFGIAGLRVGYAVGQPAVVGKMASWLLGSNTSQLGLIAATAAVTDAQHIALEQKRNRATRAFTRKFFQDAGFKVFGSDANFMMVDIHRDSKAFKLECVKHNVAVGRQFPALPNYVRVSIGTMEEMRKALPVFKANLA